VQEPRRVQFAESVPAVSTEDQENAMANPARIVLDGDSQAVRLPKEFRFKGDCVRVRKIGDTVVLAPIIPDIKAWFAEAGRLAAEAAFQKGWRHQSTRRKPEPVE
jgi:virulence-associated protein VagC